MVDANLALAERLELAEHARRAAAAAAASEGSDGIHGWIFQHDVGESAHLLAPWQRRKVLVPLDDAADAARILLREKSGIDMKEEVSAEDRGKEGRSKDQQLPAKNPLERDIVKVQEMIKSDSKNL